MAVKKATTNTQLRKDQKHWLELKREYPKPALMEYQTLDSLFSYIPPRLSVWTSESAFVEYVSAISVVVWRHIEEMQSSYKNENYRWPEGFDKTKMLDSIECCIDVLDYADKIKEHGKFHGSTVRAAMYAALLQELEFNYTQTMAEWGMTAICSSRLNREGFESFNQKFERDWQQWRRGAFGNPLGREESTN